MSKCSTARKTSQRIVDKHDEQVIRKLIAEKPDVTLAKVAQALAKLIHPGRVCRTLARMNLPRKKSSHASEQLRPDVA